MAINSSSTKAELLDYLKEVHGENMPSATKLEILKRLSEIEGVDYEQLSAPATKSKNSGAIANSGKITIRIPSEDKTGGRDDVFVGVNGVSFLIQRDVDVEVPMAVYHNLNDAKQTIYRNEPDGSLTSRQVHTYPFSVVSR
jgi:hypothetical protein